MPQDPPSLQPIPSDLRGTLGFLVAKTRQFLGEEIEQVLRAHDFSLRHFSILHVIHRGGLRQIDICGAMGIDRTTVMKLVDELEKRDLVRRVRHVEDRRAYTVEVTPSGQALLKKVLPDVIAQEQSFMAPLSPGERALLQEMLLRLVDASLDRRKTDNHS